MSRLTLHGKVESFCVECGGKLPEEWEYIWSVVCHKCYASEWLESNLDDGMQDDDE